MRTRIIDNADFPSFELFRHLSSRENHYGHTGLPLEEKKRQKFVRTFLRTIPLDKRYKFEAVCRLSSLFTH
jgi:hypothetical protein